MKIIITVEELMNCGKWEEFCELKGIDPYAPNEGLMHYEKEFELSIDEFKLLGIEI